MLFSDKESLEDRLVKLLLSGELNVRSIEEKLASQGVRVTTQGVYKSLRALVSLEIIIKRGQLYSLSEEWRGRVVDELSQMRNRFALAEGESIKLGLGSLIHLDQQWKNIVIPLQAEHPDQPIFLYNVHDIWVHISPSRRESERAYYESFTKKKTYAFHAIGGKTIHDEAIRKEFRSEYMHITLGVQHFPKTDYPTIMGDYVITTRISPRLADEIEKQYQTSPDKATLEAGLSALGIERKRVKLIIERDREKAKKLRRRLAKDFYVPQELIKKFDLY